MKSRIWSHSKHWRKWCSGVPGLLVGDVVCSCWVSGGSLGCGLVLGGVSLEG